jgi:hypothetical protein
MVKPRPVGLLSLGGVLLLIVVGFVWRSSVSGQGLQPRTPGEGALGEDLPEIGLSRVEKVGPDGPVGRRDIFRYGAPPRAATPVHPPDPHPLPVPVLTPQTMHSPTLPPLNVHFIGTVENKRGLRVAVLLTDQKEVLTGQAGDIVANRFRIVRIGLESVELQDMGSDSVRRIPLRGN